MQDSCDLLEIWSRPITRLDRRIGADIASALDQVTSLLVQRSFQRFYRSNYSLLING